MKKSLVSGRKFVTGVPIHESNFRHYKVAEKADFLLNSFYPPHIQDRVCEELQKQPPTQEEMELASRLWLVFARRYRLSNEVLISLARRLLKD